MTAICILLRGVKTLTPVYGSAFVTSDSETSRICPALDVQGVGDWLLYHGSCNNQTTVSFSAGIATIAQQINSSNVLRVGYKIAESTGNTTGPTVTYGGSSPDTVTGSLGVARA
jgi:hypothetical protein